MALFVRIDRTSQSAIFSGPGTYHAKEKIKEIGRARFLRETLEWQVTSFTLSREDLEIRFPGIVVEEIGDVVVRVEVSASSPAASPAEALASAPETEPAANAPAGLSVPQFLSSLRNAVRIAFPGSFCIYGVVRQVKRTGDDRMFIDLGAGSESDEYVGCAIWSGASRICRPLEEKGFQLTADLEVMLEVSINVSGKGGYVSLSVKRIVVEYTIARLAALRDQTNERLRKEGIFTNNRELALPFLPRRLGILTSSSGTVIHDFMASLNEAQFGFELLWYPVAVQGSEAKSSLLRGLEVLGAVRGIDAILIFRGGGSQADLSVFNDFDIARAVCLAPVPVISAIGHQEDECSVQDVSFIGRGVPKDIGRFFADIIRDLRERFRRAAEAVVHFGELREGDAAARLQQVAQIVAADTRRTVGHRAAHLNTLADALPRLCESVFGNGRKAFLRLIGPLQVLGIRKQESALQALNHRSEHVIDRAERCSAESRSSFASLCDRALHALSGRLDRVRFRLLEHRKLLGAIELLLEQRLVRVTSLEELIQSLGPEAQLRRGFVLARSVDGTGYLTSAAAADDARELRLQFHDGERTARLAEHLGNHTSSPQPE